ncbi:hypothetical protein FPQ18DRAFT_324357 [Pyronema domesticum]|uniref:Similar to Uncharacterized RING finger protein YBR062C acc. no. P38239 n=1 Tax=Pyronema omphalodes (strain CBS 100304) TaxID=1076935 RepID=U4L8R3_PYROM|nr:hypothetical protein FPQ18DRAFT_324357 [Pyronema domesticum]CCX06504.1 Similar to Uncharacterized RING finger protein YBR062C; acc. no. P38239 [Pyronema omphalodes CBS 100304]
MTSYYDDHNIPHPPSTSSSSQAQAPRRAPRLDLDEFFGPSSLGTSSSSFRVLANAISDLPSDTEVQRQIVAALLSDAACGKEVKGLGQEFLDTLERVPKNRLKEDDVCPVCNERFLEDQYPLVVRLPCHKDHKFDLECIAPWLKLKSTCPLDRKELGKKAAAPVVEDSEDEWDPQYG